MSGHSKWAQIKHKKAAADAKKGQQFTRIAKLIAVAARDGADPSMNFKLRLAVEKARLVNMPKDNVERAIQRGAGTGNEVAPESVLYEGYGPGGAAILIEAVTDNRNRTSAEVRHTLDKSGGKMAGMGSVQWMFQRLGMITVDVAVSGKSQDEIEMIAIECGAQDIDSDDVNLVVYCEPEKLEVMREALQKQGLTITEASIGYRAKDRVEITGEDEQKLLSLLEALNENEDVQEVYTNLPQ